MTLGWPCNGDYQEFLLADRASVEFLIVSDDNLLIGTREGHLLMYNVPTVFDDSHKLELLRHSKNFNKKRINQIDVVPEYNLLIILTGTLEPTSQRVNLLGGNISVSHSNYGKLQITLYAFTI